MREEYDSDGLIVKYEFDRRDEEWIEASNQRTSTSKRKATSFRLSTSTMTLLKQLAEKENRSLTNMVETLIMDRAKEEGLTK